MADPHVIELALDAASLKKVRGAISDAIGGKFWKESYKQADNQLKKHIQNLHKLGDKAAGDLSREFSGMFGKAAASFGGDLQKAARTGSDAYVKAMTKAYDRIQKIEAEGLDARADAIGKIINDELKATEKRLDMESDIRKEREKGARGPKGGLKGGLPKGKYGKRAQEMGESITGAGKKVSGLGGKIGGKAGKTLAKVGGVIGKLGKMAGPLGVLLQLVDIVSKVAKAMYAVQKQIKRLNKSMLSSVTATDLVAAGATDVSESINSLRNGFLGSWQVMNKWRMTGDEAYQTLNALVQSGISLSKVQKDLGKSTEDAAMDMVITARAYSTILGSTASEVGQVMTDMMNNMSYSFERVVDTLAIVQTSAKNSGVAAGTFFAKVQSINAQLGLMNGNLGFQAKLLSKLSKEGTLGFEQAAKAAGTLMGAVSEDTARTMAAWLSESGQLRSFLERELERVGEKMKITTDEGALRRLERNRKEFQQALDSMDIGEAGQAIALALDDETTNMELRMRAVAGIFGKSLEEFKSSDLEDAWNLEDTEMVKKLADVGVEVKDVGEALMEIEDIMAGQPNAAAAIDKLHRESMKPQVDAIDEDFRMAESQLRETEDIGKVLTNIKELLLSKIYDLMLMMYGAILEIPGVKDLQSSTMYAFDKALRSNYVEQETLQEQIAKAKKEGDTKRAETLEEKLEGLRKQEEALSTKRAELSGLSKEKFETKAAQQFGGAAIAEDIVSSVRGKAGSTAATTMSRMGATVETNEAAVAAETKTRAASEFLGNEEWGNYTGKGGGNPVVDFYEYLKFLYPEAFDSSDRSIPSAQKYKGAPNDPKALLRYVRSNRDVFSRKADYFDAGFFDRLGGVALAEGGIVNRPTVALLGEKGPEAVTPLGRGGMGRGGLIVNFYGGVWNEDQLTRKLQEAFSQYDRSQKV